MGNCQCEQIIIYVSNLFELMKLVDLPNRSKMVYKLFTWIAGTIHFYIHIFGLLFASSIWTTKRLSSTNPYLFTFLLFPFFHIFILINSQRHAKLIAWIPYSNRIGAKFINLDQINNLWKPKRKEWIKRTMKMLKTIPFFPLKTFILFGIMLVIVLHIFI